MASVYREIVVDVPASRAWAALQDMGRADRLFAGVLVSCSLAEGVRTVEFANGFVAKERVITVDHERRRVVYSALNEAFVHHSATMQIVAEGDARCRFVWTSDVLPEQAADRITPLIDAGCAAVKKNLEGGAA
ncbi:hypothetical protein GCM10011507_22330 [Edaphobacter acidisoli]|uniref:SRPBCC family protein n=1 Tax=Edaphobacter acidisoli TaxID=2040573 RepID=A0A916W6I4_9BACT|nr:SRPBCC family protein [Edaphobacter acidisoli]GGA70330.1 hypothetical protein GCM10011507_22330 [Edaphobacter acidisoli]